MAGNEIASLLILSLPFDGLRYGSVSPTNVISVVFLARVARDRILQNTPRPNSLWVSALGFLGWAIVSTWFAADPADSAGYLGSMVLLVGCSIGMTLQLYDGAEIRRAVRAWIWMGGVTALICWGEIALFVTTGWTHLNAERNSFLGGLLVAPAGFLETNGQLAFHMIPGFLLAAECRRYSRVPRERRLLRVYTIVMAGSIVVSGSRAAMVTILLYVLMNAIRDVRTLGPRRLIAVSVLAASTVAMPLIVVRVINMNSASSFARYALVRGGIQASIEHPLFGLGLGANITPIYSGHAWKTVDDADLEKVLSDENSLRETHNTLLQISTNMGFVGLGIFLWMIARTYRASGPVRRYFNAPLPLLGCLIASRVAAPLMLFCSLFNSLLFFKPIWMFLGLMAALSNANIRPKGLRGPGYYRRTRPSTTIHCG